MAISPRPVQRGALVDFGDQITKIYHQGTRAAQHTFEQPCGRHHTLQHRDEMRRDRVWGRSKNTLLNSERRRSPKFTRASDVLASRILKGRRCRIRHPRLQKNQSHLASIALDTYTNHAKTDLWMTPNLSEAQIQEWRPVSFLS